MGLPGRSGRACGWITRMISFSMGSNGWPRRAGIYAVRHVESGKCYVGRAAGQLGFYKRWSEHRRTLRRGKHANRHLQAAFNLHGEEAFAFDILEFCATDQTGAREAYWCDYIGAHFNIEPVDPTTGAQRHSPEVQAKIIAANAKPFMVKAPDGTIYQGRNLKEFCRTHGLAQSAMSLLIRGKSSHKHHHGWTLPERTLTPEELAFTKPKSFTVISPAGEVVHYTKGQSAFAREQGIQEGHLSCMLRGKPGHLSCKGWRPLPD